MAMVDESARWMAHDPRDLRFFMDDFGFNVCMEEKEKDNMGKTLFDDTVYTIGIKKFVPVVGVTDIAVLNYSQ